jgi:hypothetical protein
MPTDRKLGAGAGDSSARPCNREECMVREATRAIRQERQHRLERTG